VERTGGFTGMPQYSEIKTDNLPSSLEPTLKKIMNSKKTALAMKSPPKGAADYYTYKISIKDGRIEGTIVCNQYDIQDDLKSLIKYVEKNSEI
jgi:hypothetical protein